jgi:hypothetical protein
MPTQTEEFHPDFHRATLADELVIARYGALHEKLTAWVTMLRDEAIDDISCLTENTPERLVDLLMQRLTHSGDARILTTPLARL